MKLRRVFTLLLALLMLASPLTEVLPAIVYAEETQQETTVPETTEAPTEEATEATTEVATEAPTEAPVETTEAATEAPVETTEAPEETTEATEAPVETTEAPEETTEATEAAEIPEETEAEADDTILASDETLIKTLTITNNVYSATLEWNEVEDATGYLIYEKGPYDDEFHPLTTLNGSDVTSHTVLFTDEGSFYFTGKYQYKVVPLWYGEELTPSKTVSTVYVEMPGLYCYPDGKRMTVGFSFGQFRQKGGIVIERSANATNTKWTKIKTVTAQNMGIYDSFADAKANVSGKLYTYRARVFITIGGKTHYGPYCTASNYYIATPKVTAITRTDEGMKVTWNQVKGAEEYVLLLHSFVNGEDTNREVILKITDPTAATVEYLDTTAVSVGYYDYQIQARALHPDYNPDWYYEELPYTNSDFSSYRSAAILDEPEIEGIVNTSKGVELYWSWVDYADKYEVWRSTDGVNFTKIKTLNGSTYFHDTTANRAGKTYTYKIRALSIHQSTTFRSEFGGTKDIVNLAAPVIKNVKKPATGGFSVTFNRVANAEYYEIQFEADGGFYKDPITVKQFKGKTYTFKDPDATLKNVVYNYIIIAKNDTTGGNATSVATAINYGDTNFTLKNSSTGIQIQAHSPLVSHYNVYKKVGSGAFKLLKKVAVNRYTGSLDFVDKNVVVGKTYSYKLQPVSNFIGAYRTQQSSVQSILRIGGPTLSTPLNKNDGIELTWKPNAKSPAIVRYEIYRAADNWGYGTSDFEQIASLDNTVTSYLDTGVSFQEHGLAYRVDAVLEDGTAVSSLTKTTFRLPTPHSLEGYNKTNARSCFTWDSEGYCTGSQIRLVDANNKSRIVTKADGWGYMEVDDLKQNTAYTVSVRHFFTYNGVRVYSEWSAPFTLER